MCNHCHNHGAGEESKNQVRRGFLKMLADSSSQMSKMQAAIIIKNFGGGKNRSWFFWLSNEYLRYVQSNIHFSLKGSFR